MSQCKPHNVCTFENGEFVAHANCLVHGIKRHTKNQTLSDDDFQLAVAALILQADDSPLRSDLLEEFKVHGRGSIIENAREALEDDTRDTLPPDDAEDETELFELPEKEDEV